MAFQGWYYLHTNGSLIYKKELGGTAADIRDSDFARALWPLDADDRESAWRIVIEASAAGANPQRVQQLADLWQCTDIDADIYAERTGCTIERDGSAWCAKPLWFVDLQQSPAGFGQTKLAAMAELCKALGYKPAKMWGNTFRQLLERKAA